MMTGALKTLFAVAEKYPDLKANTNFMQLQGRITELETKIAGQRTTFNDDVNVFNIRIAQIPANFVAGFMGLQPPRALRSRARRPRGCAGEIHLAGPFPPAQKPPEHFAERNPLHRLVPFLREKCRQKKARLGEAGLGKGGNLGLVSNYLFFFLAFFFAAIC